MTSDWESGPHELTLEDVDTVMVFLPIFEKPGFKFGEWRPYRNERSEVELPIGYCSMAPELQAFMETLYEHRSDQGM